MRYKLGCGKSKTSTFELHVTNLFYKCFITKTIIYGYDLSNTVFENFVMIFLKEYGGGE